MPRSQSGLVGSPPPCGRLTYGTTDSTGDFNPQGFGDILVAVPVAFLGALVGGLVLPWFLGPLVFGGVPPIAGSYAGFVMGRTQSAAPGWRSR
jgi:hypothetical protein